MKKIITLFAMLLISAIVWAQNPKLSYQAVVRDNANKLVTNSTVDVTISVLKADNSPQYTQTFSNVSTNQNGLFSLLLGGETGWDEVSWLHSKIAVAITLPDHSVVKDTSEVNAVPLAINTIHAAPVDPTSQVQSDWNQTDGEAPSFIKNKPDVSTAALCDSVTDCVLGHVQNYMDSSSHFQSLVGDQISDSIASIPHTKPDWNAATGSDAEILNKPTLATVATSGSYNDLTDKPTIPTTVAELTDASDYAKLAGENAFSAKNTFSDNVTFTDTVVIPSGFTFGTTTTNTCGNVAVNACDLLAVFDSLYKRMDEIKENLQNQIDSLKAILDSSKTTPVILSLTGTPHSTSIDVAARISFDGSPITSREFCYVKADMTDTTCVSSNSNEKTLEGLTPNTEYYIWVKATNEIGTSSSEPVLVKTLPGTPELSNEKVSASDDHVVVSADIDLKGADEGQLTLCYVVTGETDTVCLAPKTVTGTSFSEEIPGLDTNKTYTIVVTLDNGGETPATSTEDATTLVLKVTSDTYATVKLCGDTLKVTYTATIANPDNYTYAWKVNGADSASATGNTLVVNFTTAGSYKVKCVATNTADASVTAKDSVTTTAQQGGVIPSMDICTDCNVGSITVKTKTNVASIVWRNASNDSVSNSMTGLTQSATIPAGIYTATAKSSDGCTVTRTAVLGEYVAHPCTVTSLRTGTDLGGDKYANKEYGSGTRLDSVSDHEGNVYRVVQIGEGANAQCWLAENMRAKTSPSSHKTIVMNPMVESYSSKSAGYYSNKESQYGKYGVLYNWCAAVDTFYAVGSKPELANGSGHISTSWSVTMPAGNRRGICPEGWHVPTDAEWTTLTTNAGVEVDSGTGLGKLTGGCDWSSWGSGSQSYPGNYSYSERNSSGFSALPAGEYYRSKFYSVGDNAYFWSSTPYESNCDYAYGRRFYYDYEYVDRGYNDRYSGFSVRCLRDNMGVTLGDVTKTDSTENSLSISAGYTATKTVTSATICAYTNENCTEPATPICASSVDFASSPITGTIEGLEPNTQYYVKVTATTEGDTESKVGGPFRTKELKAPSIPVLGLCETCNEGTITVKVSENVESIVWRNASNDSVSNSMTGLTQSATIPAGIYTATAKSSDGCTVTRTATLGKATAHPCTVTSLRTGTDLGGDKYANKEYGTGTQLDSVSDHEGNVYRVVQIGEGANAQCWLAENMRATTSPSTGSTIVMNPMVQSFSSKSAGYYGNNESQYGKYGVLYNWCAAVDTFYAVGSKPELANESGHSSTFWSVTMPAGNRRGICPEGWHVPTDAEWSTMPNAAGCTASYDSGTGLGKLTGGCD